MEIYETEAWHQMMSGKPYNACNPMLIDELNRVKHLIAQYNTIDPRDAVALDAKIREILGECGVGVKILQPFRCDYGRNIHIGDNTFINFNLTVLDEALVTIGNNVLIGPNVSIYTACHPLDVIERRKGIEWSLPVTIEDDCWIGGSVVILPGVSIGQDATIGAGSVVTKNVPSGEVWAGNPARCITRHSGEIRN